VTIRVGVIALLAVLAALAGLRVLAPAEVSYPVTAPIPAPDRPKRGLTARLAAAPLIVQDRIRVYGSKRMVRADAPVRAKTMNTPVWSYRRWPQQLTGVVAVGTTVVSRWSDGDVVALDGNTGRIAWRAGGPGGGTYTGGRTGSATVWDPPGLHTSGDVVIAGNGRQVAGYAAATGARRWQAAVAGSCFGTAGGQLVCGRTVLDAASGSAVTGWPPGPYAPVGCGVAASDCGGVRDASGHGWLTGVTPPQRSAALDRPSATVAGGLVVDSTGGAVVALAPFTGAEVWRWAGAATVLGGGPGRVYVLTPDRLLVGLSARAGSPRAYGRMGKKTDDTDWTPGRRQITGTYVAVERIGDPDPGSVNHLFSVDADVVTAVT
jgi:hypothetical protein